MQTRKLFVKNLQEDNKDEIKNVLHSVWGIRDVNVNTNLNEIKISFNEDAGSLIDFEQALTDMGYEVSSSNEES